MKNDGYAIAGRRIRMGRAKTIFCPIWRHENMVSGNRTDTHGLDEIVFELRHPLAH
jgi:hypothetical protein